MNDLSKKIEGLKEKLTEIEGKSSQGAAAFIVLRSAAAAKFLRIQEGRCSKIIASINELSNIYLSPHQQTDHLVVKIDNDISESNRAMVAAGIPGASELREELEAMDNKRIEERSIMDMARSDPAARWNRERDMLLAKAAKLKKVIKKAREEYTSSCNAPLNVWRPEP